MTDQLVLELMAEWNTLSEDPLSDNMKEFCESILNNEDLFQAITHVLDESDRFRSLYGDVISVLFALYRAPLKKLRIFSCQFIPSLIYVYLNQIHSQKKCVALETLLRGIFELESTFEEIIPASARIANVNLPSVYHDPGGVSTSWLSDNDLDRLNLKTVKIIKRPTLVLNDERIRAPHRLPLCTELWWIFNHRLPEMSKHSIPMHLKVISKLVTQGFTAAYSQKLQPPIRIVLSSKLVVEMIQTTYFSAYNGSPTVAEQVLEEISARSNYQLWADALLACNAVQDYLKSSELPIQVEVSNFKKSIITNASFRTKKLPDDIPIVERTDSTEGEPDTPTTTLHLHSFKAKSKIPNILSKIKRNSVVAINEEENIETTLASPPSTSSSERERKKSVDATAV